MSNEFSASSISELEKDERKYNSGSSTIKKISQTNVKIINHFDNIHNFQKKKTFNNRLTLPYLTKFEKARILGARSLQISMGAPLMIKHNLETDSLEIAARELKDRKIPITIRRFLPNGEYEDWKLDELIID